MFVSDQLVAHNITTRPRKFRPQYIINLDDDDDESNEALQ